MTKKTENWADVLVRLEHKVDFLSTVLGNRAAGRIRRSGQTRQAQRSRFRTDGEDGAGDGNPSRRPGRVTQPKDKDGRALPPKGMVAVHGEKGFTFEPKALVDLPPGREIARLGSYWVEEADYGARKVYFVNRDSVRLHKSPTSRDAALTMLGSKTSTGNAKLTRWHKRVKQEDRDKDAEERRKILAQEEAALLADLKGGSGIKD